MRGLPSKLRKKGAKFMKLLIVTGLSRCWQNYGYQVFGGYEVFCVDNLPPQTDTQFVKLCEQSEGRIDRVAIVVDIRGRGFFDDLLGCLSENEK